MFKLFKVDRRLVVLKEVDKIAKRTEEMWVKNNTTIWADEISEMVSAGLLVYRSTMHEEVIMTDKGTAYLEEHKRWWN